MSCLGMRAAAVIAAFAAMVGPAVAQSEQGAHVLLELNAVEPLESACRISFLVQNGHDADISRAVYEAVLFDAEGRVDRLTLFDMGELPSARPRVRQFNVPGLVCADLGRLLINGSETCTGPDLPASACTEGLELRSLTEIEVLG